MIIDECPLLRFDSKLGIEIRLRKNYLIARFVFEVRPHELERITHTEDPLELPLRGLLKLADEFHEKLKQKLLTEGE